MYPIQSFPLIVIHIIIIIIILWTANTLTSGTQLLEEAKLIVATASIRVNAVFNLYCIYIRECPGHPYL